MKSIKILNVVNLFFLCCFALPFSSCGQGVAKSNIKEKSTDKTIAEKQSVSSGKTETATFAAGCFWCVEEQFKQLEGVVSVTSGYTGGTTENPTYEEVSAGNTNHAEACNIVFDPAVISYKELLEAFFVTHDPTQLNRQGNDVGTQYRSAVFYHNQEQKQITEFYIDQLNKEKAYDKPVVTQVAPFKKFYKAEDYHQNYYENNPDQAYCRLVVKPKVDKFRKAFSEKLKK
ncbi:MAG: peptide-methionine (S)-S-oxide reductase MsrA [Flavobacterium sp.]